MHHFQAKGMNKMHVQGDTKVSQLNQDHHVTAQTLAVLANYIFLPAWIPSCQSGVTPVFSSASRRSTCALFACLVPCSRLPAWLPSCQSGVTPVCEPQGSSSNSSSSSRQAEINFNNAHAACLCYIRPQCAVHLKHACMLAGSCLVWTRKHNHHHSMIS